MNHFYGGSGGIQSAMTGTQRLTGGVDQQCPQAFTSTQGGVAHGFQQPRRRLSMTAETLIKHNFNLCLVRLHPVIKREFRIHDSSVSGSKSTSLLWPDCCISICTFCSAAFNDS